MGKLKAAIQDFLENGGHDLGYDMSNAPALEDFKNILDNSIDAHTYWNSNK
tara:strand:+ start:303 stop:455 length:153 start_codon:yes stop_codon:yes gene_type:complete